MTSTAPLDIFLMRAHALPLRYLTAPSVSFLVYTSPLTYLTLLHTTSPAAATQSTASRGLPQLDVPFNVLQSMLASHPRPKGITMASLVLSTAENLTSMADSVNIAEFITRPTFPLAPTGVQADRALPQATQLPGTPLHAPSPAWVLDLTEGGKYPGVVLSQTRMREIELLLNPLSGMDQLHGVHPIAFGMGSWLDLLVSVDWTAFTLLHLTLGTS